LEAREVGELFEYLIDTRAKLLTKFRRLGWEKFVENREASWGSMLGIFLHILDVEDCWLHYAFHGLAIDQLKPPEPATFQQVADYNSMISAKTKALFANLSDADLWKDVQFKESKGFTRRVGLKIVMHAFIDELAHIGELMCLLWQLDSEPPYIDWLDYHLT
jgi:uncharacterized damage-inducible protein DinB